MAAAVEAVVAGLLIDSRHAGLTPSLLVSNTITCLGLLLVAYKTAKVLKQRVDIVMDVVGAEYRQTVAGAPAAAPVAAPAPAAAAADSAAAAGVASTGGGGAPQSEVDSDCRWRR